MGFISEVFRAAILAGVPIGLFTFALIWWALRGGHFKEVLDRKALEKEMKQMAKAGKKNAKKAQVPQHPLQRKWAKFGGGFYGIVAFFTYIVIEATEIATIIINFGGFWGFLSQLSFDVIIRILIEALTNFITAMVWPLYWMGRVDSGQVWIWFGAAYGGYWLGLKQAQAMHQRSGPAES